MRRGCVRWMVMRMTLWHRTGVRFRVAVAMRPCLAHACGHVAAPGSDGFLKQLQKSCQAPDRLQLKVGTQVILLKNISVDMGLVNGSRGVVVEFKPVQDDPGQPPTILPRVRFSVGDRTVERIIKQEVRRLHIV